MKLKKWLTGVLAAAMALSLAACSDGGAESADAGSEDSITLGFAQVGSESEWRTANTDNIKAAAEAAGVTPPVLRRTAEAGEPDQGHPLLHRI